MGEDMRIVKVEDVHDIGITKGLEKDHVVIVVPISPGGKDGVRGRSLADCGGQLGLNAIPAIRVPHLGLIQDFKEDALWIPGGIMFSQGAPEIGKAFDKIVVLKTSF